MVSSSKVLPQTLSIQPADFAQSRISLQNLISIPFDNPGKYPVYAQSAGIAVFDETSVDVNHCAFRESARFDFGIVPGKAISDCSVSDDPIEGDHATHIVGLIGGRYTDSTGKDLNWGVNPRAKVMERRLDLSQAALDPLGTGLQGAADEIDLVDGHPFNIGVVNLSLRYPVSQNASHDPIEDVIEAKQNKILFVAAAGNEGANKSHICDIRPACINLPNVISVAALNSDLNHPNFLKNSSGKGVTNYGSNIDIGAIGDSRSARAILNAQSRPRPY